jgi:exodeoxyribonuclease III
MRILTLNCNGIRSAARKGLFDWLPAQQADFVCLQETKAQEHQLDHGDFRPAGYHCEYFDAEKKGYAGTAVYSRVKPDRMIRGFGVDEFDREGRYLEVQVGRLSVVSLYLPSGSSGPERQASKFRFLDAFRPHMAKLMRRKRDYVLCGDWNIAHKPIDLRNWKSNQKNSGFLPEERAWLSSVFDDLGWVDVHRRLQPEASGEAYTWWSNRGQAWAKNVGWRIDYQIATPGLAAAAQRATVYKERRFSDHAPLIIDYDLTLP